MINAIQRELICFLYKSYRKKGFKLSKSDDIFLGKNKNFIYYLEDVLTYYIINNRLFKREIILLKYFKPNINVKLHMYTVFYPLEFGPSIPFQ